MDSGKKRRELKMEKSYKKRKGCATPCCFATLPWYAWQCFVESTHWLWTGSFPLNVLRKLCTWMHPNHWCEWVWMTFEFKTYVTQEMFMKIIGWDSFVNLALPCLVSGFGHSYIQGRKYLEIVINICDIVSLISYSIGTCIKEDPKWLMHSPFKMY